mmetsp:Transcript_152/g.578  ORF Transcript_152/g.578 Transcript_152/m.578 type:complete len:359 (-) Transcript_152:170-1246(-)
MLWLPPRSRAHRVSSAPSGPRSKNAGSSNLKTISSGRVRKSSRSAAAPCAVSASEASDASRAVESTAMYGAHSPRPRRAATRASKKASSSPSDRSARDRTTATASSCVTGVTLRTRFGGGAAAQNSSSLTCRDGTPPSDLTRRGGCVGDRHVASGSTSWRHCEASSSATPRKTCSRRSRPTTCLMASGSGTPLRVRGGTLPAPTMGELMNVAAMPTRLPSTKNTVVPWRFDVPGVALPTATTSCHEPPGISHGGSHGIHCMPSQQPKRRLPFSTLTQTCAGSAHWSSGGFPYVTTSHLASFFEAEDLRNWTSQAMVYAPFFDAAATIASGGSKTSTSAVSSNRTPSKFSCVPPRSMAS